MKTEIKTNLKLGTFQATREFNAELSLVWRAFTEATLLDQWWALTVIGAVISKPF